MERVVIRPAFEDWRRAARALLAAGARPESVVWIESPDAVGTTSIAGEGAAPAQFSVPREFVAAAERVAVHADPSRWGLLYRVLWRIVHDDRLLLQRELDPDVMELHRLEGREASCVRARTLTPRPAGLLDELQEKPATAFFPEQRTLAALRDAAGGCTACPLYKNATQTVFGLGPPGARAMFVGEQPGEQEDLAGKPFVGPAGEVLTRALAEAGIPRDDVYITNAVKHFKWEPRGKRRIHQTPRAPEIDACRPWLEAEIEALKPSVLVCLGSTAAQALMGPQVRIMRDRGVVFQSRWAPWVMATVHPSSILRADPGAPQDRAYADFVADLRKVAARLSEVRVG
ncbi:MAG TPA: UdgX family uracil-DNA binding protein [Vicinamibacterales bacterium]|jgi:DNA polymerase|nr:UdgX family uracil-DNA binding protein [Vicinamibacterales bacterium]